MSTTPDEAPQAGDQVLEAVGFTAERFLTADSWEQVIPEVLERLGRATDVSRVYVYENSVREDGELVMSQRWEWCGPDVQPTLGWQNTVGYPYSDGYMHFRDELAAGRAIYGLTREFPESEQADMELEGIVSNAVVPIFVGANWWGYMGFDHCIDEHLWTAAEIDALLAAAGTLGATIYRKQVESQLAGTAEELHAVEQRYQALVEQIPAVLYMDPIDIHGTTLYVSPQVEEILGVTQEDYLADPDMWRKLLHPDDLERAESDYASYLETGSPEASDYRMIRPDGRIVWLHDRATILRDESGKPFITQGVMFDVTKQKEAEQQVAFMAYHDRLTGLPNRAMFEEHLEFALARAARTATAVAVLFMDLDNFKILNDTKGHAAGDELLQKIALRMQDATRETDLVARQGGDEFLVLIGDIEMEGEEEGSSPYVVAESVASRVLQSLETPFRIDGEDYHTSASIGIAIFPMDARDATTLLMNADSAMYRSKRSGTASYTVHRDEQDVVPDAPTFAARLREAADKQEWEVRYHPIVELDSGRLVTLEALVRWRDPTGGLIRPGEFLPLAEEIGVIDAIGDWVLDHICSQLEEWRDEGLGMDISYNLSPRQLRHPDLAEHLLPFLSARHISPASLIVEVSEATAMTDPERTQKVFNSLRSAGLRVALDDFGTGGSSLARLQHLPVDILKIDQSFVRDLAAEESAASMIMAMVQTARALDISLVAEGVETEQQRRMLVRAGCTLGQGYLFSRPLPADRMLEALRNEGRI